MDLEMLSEIGPVDKGLSTHHTLEAAVISLGRINIGLRCLRRRIRFWISSVCGRRVGISFTICITGRVTNYNFIQLAFDNQTSISNVKSQKLVCQGLRQLNFKRLCSCISVVPEGVARTQKSLRKVWDQDARELREGMKENNISWWGRESLSCRQCMSMIFSQRANRKQSS